MESRLAVIVREHQAEVRRSYYLNKTFRIEEYEEMISAVADAKSHANKQELQRLDAEEQGLRSDLNRQLAWLKYYTQRVEELSTVDSYDEMISAVKDCITEETLALSDNLITCMWEQFIEPFTFVGRSCEKTMKSVFNDKISKSSLKDIRTFFDQLKNHLIRYLLTVKECSNYDLTKKQLKTHFIGSVNIAYEHLFAFIGKKILFVEYDEVHDSAEAKELAKKCIAQLNQMLADTLNQELKDAMDVILTREKDYFGVVASYFDISTPSSDICTSKMPKSTDSFVKSLPNGSIEVNRLVEMWNSYFGTTVSPKSLCQKKDFKQYFDVSTAKVKGKKFTYYQKH